MRTPRRALLLVLAPALALAAVLGVLVALDYRPPWSPPRTYYVAADGSDAASGRSPDQPLRSLAEVADLHLRGGDRVRLRGGTTYDDPGGLEITADGSPAHPVVLDSYGGGTPARIAGSDGSCVAVRGDRVVVRGIVVADCAFAGVEVSGDHVTVERVEASGSLAGVYVAPGAAYTTVRGSNVHDNTAVTADTPGADDDSGAFGVLVNGTHTTVVGNRIDGQDTSSPDYGRDGAAVEVYGGRDTLVADNTADGNQTFVEVGGSPGRFEASRITLRDNRVTAPEQDTFFAVVHAGDSFGLARGVRLVGNTVSLPGAGSVGIFCGPRCTPQVLSLRGNQVTAAQRPIDVEGTFGSRDDRLDFS